MGELGLNGKDKRFKQGIYRPKNKEKFFGKNDYAIYRSGLELNYFRILDNNPNVLKWGSEEIVVPYFFDGKWHKYYIDIFAIFKSGDTIKKFIIELKPYKQTVEPKWSKRRKQSTYLYECKEWAKNQSKWEYARKYAQSKDCEFHILTEKELK